MAVVLTSDEGFILDQEQAIISAYRQCNFCSGFSSLLPQLCWSEDKANVKHLSKDESSLCLEDIALQCSESSNNNQQNVTEHYRTGGEPDNGPTALKQNLTGTAKGDTALAIDSRVSASEHVSTTSVHCVQNDASTIVLKPPRSSSTTVTWCSEVKPSSVHSGLTCTSACVSSDSRISSEESSTYVKGVNPRCKSNSVCSSGENFSLELTETLCESSQADVSHKESADKKNIFQTDRSSSSITTKDAALHQTVSLIEKENCSSQHQCGETKGQRNTGHQGKTPDSSKQTMKIVQRSILKNELVNEKMIHCPQKQADGEASVMRHIHPEHLQSIMPSGSQPKKLSLRLKQGFFAVTLPFMMDSQFEKVKHHFLLETSGHMENRTMIRGTDIWQVLQSKQRKRKRKRRAWTTEEELLRRVHCSLVGLAREHGIFLQCIPLPLDNNLSSRQCAQLDCQADIFASLLMSEDGAPLLHMGNCLEPLIISGGCDLKTFPASAIIHRRVSHTSTEASVVDIDGTGYVLPPCSEFLVSDLQDFCDHLSSELTGSGYDLIVLDPPWENKSVKRKRSYNMMDEEDLQNLPMPGLVRPGCLVALWVTNNERLEDYSLHTLFPLWGVTALARWHWLKVTKAGDMISGMDTHKKPYEVLLLGRASRDKEGASEKGRKEPLEKRVMMSVPCSLHSKKPPLAEKLIFYLQMCMYPSAPLHRTGGLLRPPDPRLLTGISIPTDVLQPYLPDKPRCLELFARNLWPGWTSWGREVLKHQNLIFYEIHGATDQETG